MSDYLRKTKVRELQDLGFGMHLVPLNGGKESLIDSVFAHLAEGKNWSYADDSYNFYATRKTPVTGAKESLHRLVMEASLGGPIPEGYIVDHINGDGLDNRLCNLRLATNRQNVRNSRRRSDNKSGFKGVSWDGQRSAWKALIHVDGKRVFLGRYDTPEEAHAAYCEAANELHGEFARTA